MAKYLYSLTQEELNNIFSRGVVPIAHSIPSELVTERNIISKPINLLQYYIDFDFRKLNPTKKAAIPAITIMAVFTSFDNFISFYL